MFFICGLGLGEEKSGVVEDYIIIRQLLQRCLMRCWLLVVTHVDRLLFICESECGDLADNFLFDLFTFPIQ